MQYDESLKYLDRCQIEGWDVRHMRDIVARLRRRATAIVTACIMASALTGALATPAFAQPAPAQPQPAPCTDNAQPTTGFQRCTSDSPNGTWAGAACSIGANYNATNGPFNVYTAVNNCNYRVWLHQDPWPEWQTSGQTLCVTPHGARGVFWGTMPSWAVHPDNIYISTNTAGC